MHEPVLRVGLLLDVPHASLVLEGPHLLEGQSPLGAPLPMAQQLTATAGPEGIRLQDPRGDVLAMGPALRLSPANEACAFSLLGMTVGVQFHWEHKEDLRFRGGVLLVARGESVTLINEVSLETYLASVVASEMSARCPPAFLRAHAIISRSWLLAQTQSKGSTPRPPPRARARPRRRPAARALVRPRGPHRL